MKVAVLIVIAAISIPYAYRDLGNFFADKEHNEKAIRAALSGGVLSNPQGFTSHCGLPSSSESGDGKEVLHYRDISVVFQQGASVAFFIRDPYSGSPMSVDEEYAMREIPCYPR